MKALLIRNAYRYDYGGGERFPVNLGCELKKSGITPIVVSRSPKLLAFARDSGIETQRGWWWARQNWSGKRAFLFPVYLVWQLVLTGWYIQLIVRLRPDIVHPQSKDDFIAATVAGRLLGKRIVWTDHADLKYVFANHSVWYKNPVGKLVYACSKLADHVTLVSHSEKRLIEEQLQHSVPSSFTVIHNGVNDMSVTPHKRSSKESKAFVFCATSRLVTAKGIGELIDAFVQLNKKYTDTALWLAGDGPEEEDFKRRANHHAAITFFGHSDEPLAYVAASDVFVHPSYHEGFSLSLVEAAMLAKPIIACNVGGNVEIVHDGSTGLLVEPRSVPGLYSAMEELYTHRPLAATLGKNARATYEASFRFERIVTERFIPLYER